MAPPIDDPSKADTVAGDAGSDPTLASSSVGSGGVTSHAPTLPGGPTTQPGARALPRRGERYRAGAVIGRGGMGEVSVALDGDIGREVAIKRLRQRDATPDAIARFLREARIQARLEHPAIVPVHDLGADADGAPFFAMKKLAGTTLAEVIDHHEDPAMIARFPRTRLLRAFADVCLAIEFAHTRGVVHRDLKPGNIMLGDFGEVYVLDWGIAHVERDHDAAIASGVITLEPRVPTPTTPSDDEPTTHAGAVMGTPGYMAPEQVRGEAIDARADVYALGAILFEIVAGVPLHPRTAALASTLAGIEARPSARGVECPPELDAACVKATAATPDARFASARELGDAVQAFLDGDRDLTVRRTLAAEHASAARAAQARGERPVAMREAGRALALDPTSDLAAQIIGQLVLEPPRETPPEVKARMAELDLVQSRRQASIGILAFVAYFAFIPGFLLQGVLDWTWFVVAYGLAAIGALNAWYTSRRQRPRLADITIGLVVNAAIVIAFSRLLGPYLIVGALGTAVISSISTYPLLVPRYWLAFGVLSTIIWLPPLFEYLGVFARTSEFTHGQLLVRPTAIDIGPSTAGLMIAFGLALLFVAGMFARRLAGDQRAAQERVELQAWHLRQLVP